MCRFAIPLIRGVFLSRRAPRHLLVVCLAFLVVASGCTPKGARNVVTGTVKLDGQSINMGTVTFVGGDKQVSSPIVNGSYRIEEPPIGQVTVLVIGATNSPTGDKPAEQPKIPKIKGPAGDMPMDLPDAGVNPPAKYSKKETSPLKIEVKGGKETIPIDLTK